MPNELLDGLMAEANHLVSDGKRAFADIQVNGYGVTIVLWDDQPIEGETQDGDSVRGNWGSIITAGTGQTLDEAIQAANRGMKPRS